MDIDTIDLLKELGMENYIEIFKENAIDIDVLKNSDVEDLKETLKKDMKIPTGLVLRVITRIKQMKKLEMKEQFGADYLPAFTESLQRRREMRETRGAEYFPGIAESPHQRREMREDFGAYNLPAFTESPQQRREMREPRGEDYFPGIAKSPHLRTDNVHVGDLIHKYEGMGQNNYPRPRNPQKNPENRDAHEQGKAIRSHNAETGRNPSRTEDTNDDESFTKKEIRLVLFGKTGCGKSATGNTILGREMFESLFSSTAVTKSCKSAHAFRGKRKIVVVDTPGIFDTEETTEKIKEEIFKCIAITSPGPHAFIMVLNIATRFTNEDERTIDYFEKQFGEQLYRYLIVLFTHQDELQKHHVSFENQIKNSPPKLRSFLQNCGGRVIIFDNSSIGAKQEEEVENLLQTILSNIAANDGKWYTNEMYEEAEQQIRKLEIERIKMEEGKRKKELEEIVKKMKDEHQEKIIQEEGKLLALQSKIDNLHKTQKSKDDQLENLMRRMKVFDDKIKESEGKEKKDLEETVESLRKQLDLHKKEELERASKIKDLKNGKHAKEKELEDMKRKHIEELKNCQESQKSFIRDAIREEIRTQLSNVYTWPSLMKDSVVGLYHYFRPPPKE